LQINELELKGAWILNSDVYGDDRGFFFESFSAKKFAEYSLPYEFVQDGYSFSKNKNTFRGLHYQVEPSMQSLCVMVVGGAMYDYIVDIRIDSPTFGKWTKNLLSAENKKILVLSHGFAHGFLTIEDNTTVIYKMSDYYDKSSERFLSYKDPMIGLDIRDVNDLIVSDRDKNAKFIESWSSI
jgi:dTDP-4-dehydrorhamnose 3,5-epimerase